MCTLCFLVSTICILFVLPWRDDDDDDDDDDVIKCLDASVTWQNIVWNWKVCISDTRFSV